MAASRWVTFEHCRWLFRCLHICRNLESWKRWNKKLQTAKENEAKKLTQLICKSRCIFETYSLWLLRLLPLHCKTLVPVARGLSQKERLKISPRRGKMNLPYSQQGVFMKQSIFRDPGLGLPDFFMGWDHQQKYGNEILSRGQHIFSFKHIRSLLKTELCLKWKEGGGLFILYSFLVMAAPSFQMFFKDVNIVKTSSRNLCHISQPSSPEERCTQRQNMRSTKWWRIKASHHF